MMDRIKRFFQWNNKKDESPQGLPDENNKPSMNEDLVAMTESPHSTASDESTQEDHSLVCSDIDVYYESDYTNNTKHAVHYSPLGNSRKRQRRSYVEDTTQQNIDKYLENCALVGHDSEEEALLGKSFLFVK